MSPQDNTRSGNMLRFTIAVTCAAAVSFAVLTNLPNGGKQSETAAYGKFHQSGFGGIYNIGHPAGARARRKLSKAEVIIPVSAVEHAIPSLARENIENLHGHYVHDEHHSPFASHLYARPKEELDLEQKEYEEKMAAIRVKWGAWDFNDKEKIRPLPNFDKVPYKDLPNTQFPEKSWQTDKVYTSNLIKEGRKLVDRVREGIYAELGQPSEGLSAEEILERNKFFAVHIADAMPATGGMAVINEKGFSMLIRKLLHSMITNDEFYYIMGGHSAAAGHGNNFQQQYTMQFANIMEPLFHKLGVRLIARNMAMGGLGTTHMSLGQATLFGEKDFLMWDSGMTEKGAEDQDLFHKQGLLGGERVPILFGGAPNNLKVETGDNLWYGSVGSYGGFPVTEGTDQGLTLPYATQYMNCAPGVDLCGGRGYDRYHSSCWEPRSDYTPTTKQGIVGGQASWHPGDRHHQLSSRLAIMLFLKAFDATFDLWEEGVKKDGFPLNESYWHVGNIYQDVRTTLVSNLNNETRTITNCEKRWEKIGLDKACRVSFSGMTDWTPHNLGDQNSILKNMKASIDRVNTETLYEGIDILPQKWKLPKGEIDVHAIAIATTYSPPQFNDDDGDDVEEAEGGRMLRKPSSSVDSLSQIEDMKDVNGRKVASNEDVVPGLGWAEEGGIVSAGDFCDGSQMTWCKRNVNNPCLLSNHNDGREVIAGNGLSGWFVVTLPELKEGLIFGRSEWWHPRGESLWITKGWTQVNNGETGGGRHLKAKPVEWPTDMLVDIAINGKIVKTFTFDDLVKMRSEIAYNESFWKYVEDSSIAGTGPVEFGLRITSILNPKAASFGISHIYFA